MFKQQRASCLVNPAACYETELTFAKTSVKKKIAVVGAGPAGLAFSVYAAQRGHRVEIFDRGSEIGGQFNYAKQIPGKEEFFETLRYFNKQIELHGITLHLNQEQSAEQLVAAGFDEIVLATGIVPRALDIKGIDHEKVKSYIQVLRDKVPIGKRVAIIGAGGIGFDVAEFLVEEESLTTKPEKWLESWGVDKNYQENGGLSGKAIQQAPSREIFLLQRKTSKVGAGLGKTTGWIHRATLQKNGVKMLAGVSYDEVNDEGLVISIDGEQQTLKVDQIIICAGQESERGLYHQLKTQGIDAHLIGGANVAAELDAKRAIRQAAELAATI